MKKIIGIVPCSMVKKENKSKAEDFYKLGNNYAKRVLESGCIPIGLAPVDNVLSQEVLELCDGFVVQGGSDFCPYHFQIIHHAITQGKKYLGICLGEQLIYVYFLLKSELDKQGYKGDTPSKMWEVYKEKFSDCEILQKVFGHCEKFPPRGQEEKVKHSVNIVKGTLLYRVLGRESIKICSFHNFSTPQTQTFVKINAWSDKGDGVVEGLEYMDNILGVQGHPEYDDLLPELFNFLAKD